MADFRNVDATDFTGWSTGEVRAFARALSSSGVAADARAIATAGEKLADSIAELERDAAAIGTRWQGEAQDGSYAVIGQYAAQSYETGAAVTQLVGRVQSLSSTASSTKSRFGELPDPPRGETTSGGATQRAALAAELGRTYTAPVKSSASAMPLSEAGQLVSFVGVGPPLVRRDRSGTVESPEADAGPSQPVGGPGTPVGSGADPTGAVDVPDGGVGARTDAGTGSTGTGTGTEDGAGSGTRTGGESGSPAGAGTAGAGTGGGAAPSGGPGRRREERRRPVRPASTIPPRPRAHRRARC
ncbi:hypothetical protein [Tsukamurella sp. PLM1]|uniref:hypothetical protein n=1 Tax=Tsukamurella sp. PLM1 TaxID=2929795 RepID=UPI0020464B5E|nr:hypothetical protein [Tsukamurella sp. PLM1]BDH56455.1 hypothetical protein MTP03_13940 [Tsukamurella sp. PLM1]